MDVADFIIQFVIGTMGLGLLAWVLAVALEIDQWRKGELEFGDAKFTITFLVIFGLAIFIVLARLVGYAILFAFGWVG